MPNPIAHPAASIPFAKAGMVFSALVIGSISPDFGYLFPLPTPYYMYNFAGLILFDVPVGFVLLFLFHTLVKWPLLSLLPVSLQRRLFKQAQGFSFAPLKHLGLILLSLLVGSLTHIIWDSFTHEYGWIVEQFAFFSIPINGTPLYAILQNLSSIIGLIVLLYWFITWLQTAPKSDQLLARFSNGIRTLFLTLTLVSLAVVEGTILYFRISTGSRFVSGHFFLGSTIFSAIFIISFFAGIYCLAWMIAFHKTIRRAE
jgi:hypothetical protein